LLSRLSASHDGVFRGSCAVESGVTRKQLSALLAAGVITRELPDTYRMTAVARSPAQHLRAALVWAGEDAAADGRCAAAIYNLEGIAARQPEIVVPHGRRVRAPGVTVRRATDFSALMVREHRGAGVTGIEATLVALAALVDEEALEIACEDARRRRLTSVPALRAYVDRFGRPGRPGIGSMRRLLAQLDPASPSKSTLEVKTRRLLVVAGLRDFVREFPLAWGGRVHCFDFAFEQRQTILETNGRRWHDDPVDYERDNEKWSVPGRHGYRLVLATWKKVTERPGELLAELATTLTACRRCANECPVRAGETHRQPDGIWRYVIDNPAFSA
jgi:hypothetical protein